MSGPPDASGTSVPPVDPMATLPATPQADAIAAPSALAVVWTQEDEERDIETILLLLAAMDRAP